MNVQAGMVNSSLPAMRRTHPVFHKACRLHRSINIYCHAICAKGEPVQVEALDRRAVLIGGLAACGTAVAPSAHAGVLDGKTFSRGLRSMTPYTR